MPCGWCAWLPLTITAPARAIRCKSRFWLGCGGRRCNIPSAGRWRSAGSPRCAGGRSRPPSSRNRRSTRPAGFAWPGQKLPPLPLQPMKAMRLPLCSMSERLAAFLEVCAATVIGPAALAVHLQGVKHGLLAPILEMVAGQLDHVRADILQQLDIFVRCKSAYPPGPGWGKGSLRRKALRC